MGSIDYQQLNHKNSLITKRIWVILIFMATFLFSCAGQVETFGQELSSVSVEKESARIKGSVLSPSSGEKEMLALHLAYSHMVSEPIFKDGDWSFLMNGILFFWANGRLLPEDLKDQWETYVPYSFYPYPQKLPPIKELTEEQRERIDARLSERRENSYGREETFYEQLWRVSSMNSSWDRVKVTFFLGHKLMIHRDLLEDLAQVEEDIQEKAKTDRQLAAFLKTLHGVDGYNWRNIAESSSRSLHAYGVAIDLLPNWSNRNKSYWLWVKQQGIDWYSLPYSQRYMPPLSFIESFEKYGFIWGGKWFFYDTIHFEYRPEIPLLQELNSLD